MAGTGDVDAVIVADGFTDAATLPSFGGSATGDVTALPTNWPHIPVAPPIVEPATGGNAEPAGPPAATIDPPAGAGDGGAVAEPAAPPKIPVQPPAGGGAGGAIPQPGALDPVAIVAPIGGAGGGGVPIPVFWDPIIIYPILGPAIGGGGAFPVFGPIIPIHSPVGGGDGTAIITPSLPAPVPVSPPTGGAVGTDPTAVGLPLPTIPAAPPTGDAGGGATTSPVAPTGPGTTAPDGGAGGGGGATPTGPTQVPITAPTGTGTGTGTTSPTLPEVPVTAPTGGATGGDASTGVGESFPTTTVSAPAATVEAGVSTSPAVVDSQVYTEAPQATVTAISGGTTVQTSACTSCCGASCTTDIHGANGCEAVINRYCVRLYNFVPVVGGLCLPSEFTFEVTHSDRADLPGGTTCNFFAYTPGTFAPTSTGGCSGYTYSMESVGLFSINWNSLTGKFMLTMQGPRLRITNNLSVTTDYRLYNPSYGSRLAPINCSPFKLTWTNCLLNTVISGQIINILYQFDMDLEYCALSQMANPTTTQDLIQQSKTRLALPCIHRGQPLEESASCGCGGAVLTACSLYGQCRPYGTATDAQVCTRCPDYAAP